MTKEKSCCVFDATALKQKNEKSINH